MRFEERYFITVSDGASSADAIGAAGLAGREFSERERGVIERLRREPLGIALYRLFAGDNNAASKVIEILARRGMGKAARKAQAGRWEPINEVGAKLIAELVLDWFRDPMCKPCGGHGFKRMAGAPTLSNEPCEACQPTSRKDCGTVVAGRRLFDPLFPLERRELAQWMAAELERDLQRASALAMQMLAPRFDLRAPEPATERRPDLDPQLETTP